MQVCILLVVQERHGEQSEVTYPQQVFELSLEQFFQLTLGQSVGVPLLASVFTKAVDEEADSCGKLTHDDGCLKRTES